MRHQEPPTIETMTKIEDPSRWWDIRQTIPEMPDLASCQRMVTHPDDILRIVGVYVKALHTNDGWKYCGRLAKIEEGTVTVVSTLDRKTFWRGTVEEYEQMWCVD